MATVNFSVPEDVKKAFNETFRGHNKSAVIAELMRGRWSVLNAGRLVMMRFVALCTDAGAHRCAQTRPYAMPGSKAGREASRGRRRRIEADLQLVDGHISRATHCCTDSNVSL